MSGEITIVDYGMGNLRSVQKAFEHCGARAVVTSKPYEVAAAEKLVLPGVGAFGAAVRELKSRGLFNPIKDKIAARIPYLGLCLGMQLLFEKSQESKHEHGFGIVPGSVKLFKGNLKVPHMGWNTLEPASKNCPLLKGVKNEDYFYFVHSFYVEPKGREWVAASTPYGKKFCSMIWKDNVYATQFHPEKSQSAGMRIIQNFVRL